MTEKLRQSLSAAIDDEADAFELRRVLDELGRDPELRILWDRYHLIGSVLRGDRKPVPSDLRERVWHALETDSDLPAAASPPVPEAAASAEVAVSPAKTASRAGRYTGFAVAASVAFAVVLGFSGILDDGDVPSGITVSGPAATPGQSGVVLSDLAGIQTDGGAQISDSDLQRAQAYMLHHTQQQAMNQAGVMSFVKLATYEAP